MTHLELVATYVGGPTAILDVADLRLITDPTLDAAGMRYETPIYTLRKAGAPALTPDALGDIDAVLLSHDHHFDNLMARTMPDAMIIPLHYEGWAHFSEGRAEIERVFAAEGLADRLCWLTPRHATEIGGAQGCSQLPQGFFSLFP